MGATSKPMLAGRSGSEEKAGWLTDANVVRKTGH